MSAISLCEAALRSGGAAQRWASPAVEGPRAEPNLADLAALTLHAPALAIVLVGIFACLLLDWLAISHRRHVRVVAMLTAAAAAIAELPIIVGAQWDQGVPLAHGALVADHFAAGLSALACALTGGCVAMIRVADPRTSTEIPRTIRREPLLLMGTLAVATLAHASDLIVIVAGLELLGAATTVALLAGERKSASAEAAFRGALSWAALSLITWLGVALLIGAVGTTDLAALPSRVATLFTRWGGVQGDVVSLAAPSGYSQAALAAARARVYSAAAPAMLFLPGMALTLLGAMARIGLWPLHLGRGELIEGGGPSTGAFSVCVAPLAGFAVLVRVFVQGMPTARLVNEPYGWVGVVPLVCLVTLIVLTFGALRQNLLTRRIGMLVAAQFSLACMGISLGANLHGHAARVLARGVEHPIELEWARDAADAMMTASALVVVAAAVAGLGAMALASFVGADGRRRVRVDMLSGLAQHRPELALAFAICMISLVGLPPALGGTAMLAFLRGLIGHSAFAWSAGLVLALGAVAVLAGLAPVAAALLHEAAPDRAPGGGPDSRASTRVVVGCAVAGLLLGWSPPVTRGVRIAMAAIVRNHADPERSAAVAAIAERAGRSAPRSIVTAPDGREQDTANPTVSPASDDARAGR